MISALLGLLAILSYCNGVPPSMCFENFNWQDCGQQPVPVIYYWKPGSRCEVGLWRGCLPNLNMFRSEAECVSTCIFAKMAKPDDYHNLKDFYNPILSNFGPPEVTTVNGLTTVSNSTANDTLTTISGSNGTGFDTSIDVAGTGKTEAQGTAISESTNSDKVTTTPSP